MLNKLVDNGNTVLVIEHNMDIIKVADHIIDVGLEGGKGGGDILFTGTPEELVKSKKGFILGPEIEQIPMNEQFQLWVKGKECLSFGLFTYDEFLEGSEIFALTINSGEELILTKEKMGGSKTPSSERIISSKLVEL